MADIATESLLKILQSGEYDEIPDIPVFDAHEEYDDKGTLIRKFDLSRLVEIANKCNDRMAKTGDLSPFGPGHTMDGGKETDQPPIWGYAAYYKVGKFGPEQKDGLLANFYVKKEIQTPEGKISGKEAVASYPRRSVELWMKDGYIDWIALLRRTPERDLGLLTYTKSKVDDRPIQYKADKLFHDKEGRTAVLTALSAKGKLRYAMDYAAVDSTGQPDADEPDEVFLKKVIKCIKMAFPNLGENNMAEPNNPTTPVTPPATEDDKIRLQKEADAIKFAKQEERIRALEMKATRAECENMVKQMVFEGFELDPNHEVEAMTGLNADDRKKRMDYIRKYYKQAPIDDRMVVTTSGPLQSLSDPTPAQDNEYSLTPPQQEKALKYMRETNCQWEDAMKFAKTGQKASK